MIYVLFFVVFYETNIMIMVLFGFVILTKNRRQKLMHGYPISFFGQKRVFEMFSILFWSFLGGQIRQTKKAFRTIKKLRKRTNILGSQESGLKQP